MDSKAQLTVDIIAKVAECKITIVNAAKLLNKSRRTIERYLQKYQKIGIQFVVHQNSGKTSTSLPTSVSVSTFVSIVAITPATACKSFWLVATGRGADPHHSLMLRSIHNFASRKASNSLI